MNEFMKKYTITLVANNSGREKNLVVGLKVPWDFHTLGVLKLVLL
jgi:hypothetical protein